MKDSSIEGTDHTFNPWWGCTRVSAACKNCYADALAKRFGHAVWGQAAPRRFLSDSNWAQPQRWNAEAAAAGVRARVFCASMSDVFEDRRDLDEPRARLWPLIEATPQLDWLLLTKRPQAIERLAPWSAQWPDNVWLGTTVEHQKAAKVRLPYLTAIPAIVRFISAEPLLGSLDLSPWIEQLDWVITGGESGRGARPSSPSWFTSLQQQCASAQVPFLFKQWGDFAPRPPVCPGNLRQVTAPDGKMMVRLGKTAAGRALNGQTFDALPTQRGGWPSQQP